MLILRRAIVVDAEPSVFVMPADIITVFLLGSAKEVVGHFDIVDAWVFDMDLLLVSGLERPIATVPMNTGGVITNLSIIAIG